MNTVPILPFLIEVLRPSQKFFSHVGTEPTLPRFNRFCRELMCLAQGHTTVTPAVIEPRTSRFGVRRSLPSIFYIKSRTLTNALRVSCAYAEYVLHTFNIRCIRSEHAARTLVMRYAYASHTLNKNPGEFWRTTTYANV